MVNGSAPVVQNDFARQEYSAGDLNPLIQHGEELTDQFFVPKSGASFLNHGFRRLFVGQGGLIWPRGTQSIINVYDLQDSG